MSEQSQQQPAALPDLTEFEDHRAFLTAVLEREAATNPGLSMSHFAKAFGLARSGLSMILAGKRDLTLEAAHRIARALRLDQADHEIFETLVLKTQATSEQDRAYYERRLQRHRAERRTRTISTPSKTLVSEWFVPALLVYLIDVSDDPASLRDIATRLMLTESQLQQVLDALRAEGFLAYKGKGNLNIAFNRVAAMVSTQRYLKTVFAEGLRQMDRNFEDPLSFFASHCFSLSEADIGHFINDYKALLNKYLSSVCSSGSGRLRVAQANVQFFPVL